MLVCLTETTKTKFASLETFSLMKPEGLKGNRNWTVLCCVKFHDPILKISVDAASIVGTPEKELGFQHHPWRMNWRAGHPHGALPIIQVRKGEQNRADVLGLVAPCENPAFLGGAGSLIVTKAAKGSVSSRVWGGGVADRQGWEAALSLHVFILLASSPLSFLSFSARASLPALASPGCFVPVSFPVTSVIPA